MNVESDASPYQGNEDVVPGSNHDRRNALKLKQQLKKEQQQQRSSKGVAPAAPGSSATVGVLKPSRPPSGCIRPSSRDSRVSYEAMERYDQIFGGPAGPEPSSSRNIPDQF